MTTWQAVLATMRYRPVLYLANVMAMVVYFLSGQVPGLALKGFFDRLTGGEGAGLGLAAVLAILAGSGLGQGLGQYLMVTTHVPFMYSVSALLQRNILGHILSLPGASALPDSPGEAISRLRGDVDSLRWFAMGVSALVGSTLACAVALAIMLSIDWRITLFAFAPTVVVYAISQVAARRVEAYRRASREAEGAVTGFLGEVFGAVQSIKVAHAERAVVRHFGRLNQARGRTALQDSLFDSALGSIYRNAVSLGTGVILVMAGGSIRERTFTVGDLALFTYYLGFVNDLPAILGSTIAQYRRIGVSIERMTRLMAGGSLEALVRHGPIYEKGEAPAVPFVAKGEADRLQVVRAEGLCYRYPGTDQGIDAIDLTLPAGSFTVVTGRVGSGKTTLLRVLLGLLPADAGRVYWNDRPVDDPASVPSRAARSHQDRLLPLLRGLDQFGKARRCFAAQRGPHPRRRRETGNSMAHDA